MRGGGGLYGTRTYCNHLHMTPLERPRKGASRRLHFDIIPLRLFVTTVVNISGRGCMHGFFHFGQRIKMGCDLKNRSGHGKIFKWMEDGAESERGSSRRGLAVYDSSMYDRRINRTSLLERCAARAECSHANARPTSFRCFNRIQHSIEFIGSIILMPSMSHSRTRT